MGEDVAPAELFIFADAVLQRCRADDAGKILRDGGGVVFGSTTGTDGNTVGDRKKILNERRAASFTRQSIHSRRGHIYLCQCHGRFGVFLAKVQW